MERNTDSFYENMDKTSEVGETMAEKESILSVEKENNISKAALISYLLS
jgi:hypothetical protein